MDTEQRNGSQHEGQSMPAKPATTYRHPAGPSFSFWALYHRTRRNWRRQLTAVKLVYIFEYICAAVGIALTVLVAL